LLAVASHGAAPPPARAAADEATFRITLTNISTSQPLSPPILATHSARTTLINVGGTASESLRKLAEEGQNQELTSEWRGNPDVHDVVAGDLPVRRIGGDGPMGSGTSYVFTIHAGAGDLLTIASMLGCTNDAFTGAISIPLPNGIEPVFIRAQIWDAGTELNTETSLDLPDACGAQLGAQRFAEDGSGHEATNETVMNHPGLNLQGDLTDVSAWNGPVLEVKIERMGPSTFVSAAVPPPSIPRAPIQFIPPGSGFITSSSTSGGDFDQ
jgi:hypothetical protein